MMGFHKATFAIAPLLICTAVTAVAALSPGGGETKTASAAAVVPAGDGQAAFILFADPLTGRKFARPARPTPHGFVAYSDNDGRTWAASQSAGISFNAGQFGAITTVDGGPFKQGIAGRDALTAYPHAVYFATQNGETVEIALSRDGGRTFGPAIPVWTREECGTLDGEVKVAPNGTVYVTIGRCAVAAAGGEAAGEQALAISEDNGLTWDIRRLPNGRAGEKAPSVSFGDGGRVSVSYTDQSGREIVAFSDDEGRTFCRPEGEE